MKKHLIIASYDGISTYYCGIGTTMQDTIASLDEITNSEEIKVSLAYVATDPRSKVFDKRCLKKSTELVKKTGGHLIPLSNGSAGYSEFDMWQSFPQWRHLCASLATGLNMVLEKNEDNILMLHDTPFLQFYKFNQQVFGKKLKLFYMPRSSGLNHNFGSPKWRNERIRIEKEAFKSIKNDPMSTVLAIGKNFAKHLETNYDLTFGNNDHLINGLYFGRYDKFLNLKFDNSELNKFGVNIEPNTKIIFSWGRASIAKGFEELLEAWQDIAQLLPDHHMIIQAPDNSGETEYFRLLKKYENEIPRTHIINDFNPTIWQTVLRTKNTDIVCVPSIMDPIPHTAIEAKLFSSGMQYTIVGSDVDGVKDIFTNKECVWTNPHKEGNFSKKLLYAAKLSNSEKLKMNACNKKSLSQFDYAKTIGNFLKNNHFI